MEQHAGRDQAAICAFALFCVPTQTPDDEIHFQRSLTSGFAHIKCDVVSNAGFALFH